MNRTDEADRLFRILVRQRERCQRCGEPGSQVAHVLRRRYAATRCDERNAWWLCGGPGTTDCHYVVDNFAHQFDVLVAETIGAPALHALHLRAEAGPPLPLSLWWPAERARLRARLRELGLSLRGAA